MFKKMLALLLAVVMVLSVASVASASSVFKLSQVSNEIYLDPAGAAQTTYQVTYQGTGTVTVTATIHDHETGKTYDMGTYQVSSGESFDFQNGAIGEWKHYNRTRRFTLKLVDSNGKTAYATFYQTLVHAQDDSHGSYVMQETASYYANNTACTEGPHFRDIKKSMTSKWYTFSVVDLTQQGQQVFDLIGSNMYVIGEVTVNVRDDQFVVNCDAYYADQDGQTEITSEFVTFFHDLASVRTVEPSDIQSQFEFGKTYSIQNDLEGDTTVLMFVCNRVNYSTHPTDTAKLQRYWENTQPYKERREAMITLMNSESTAK